MAVPPNAFPALTNMVTNLLTKPPARIDYDDPQFADFRMRGLAFDSNPGNPGTMGLRIAVISQLTKGLDIDNEYYQMAFDTRLENLKDLRKRNEESLKTRNAGFS